VDSDVCGEAARAASSVSWDRWFTNADGGADSDWAKEGVAVTPIAITLTVSPVNNLVYLICIKRPSLPKAYRFKSVRGLASSPTDPDIRSVQVSIVKSFTVFVQ
jgi:hypothetical protein